MALTTHENIRKYSGFQSEFIREATLNDPDGSETTFYVATDDNFKIVPYLNTGNTLAGISDVQLWVGLSGILGSSQLTVTAVDYEQGNVTVGASVTNGVSLTITYSSSAISSDDIETARLRAENIVNGRLSLCYSLPITPLPSQIESFATRMAAALLLTRDYGMAGLDTSVDGWKLYEQMLGGNQDSQDVGEINKICDAGFQLVDDSGNIIPRTDETAVADLDYVSGGRVRGRIHDITEESFRRKPWQEDVNRSQPGSGM